MWKGYTVYFDSLSVIADWFHLRNAWILVISFLFNWIFYVFTYPMLFPSLISPLKLCMPSFLLFIWGCVPPQTHSCPLALSFYYMGALSFHGTKSLFSHWWPYDATYNARATLNVVKVLCGAFPLVILLT